MNPFYWFSAIWSCVLLLYPLRWSEAYAPLSGGMQAFFLATIAASLVVGFFVGKRLKRISFAYERPRHAWFFMAIILAGYTADFVYCGSVPLWDELTGSNNTYMDFPTMPVVHVLVVTFSMFFGIYMFYCFLREKRLRFKLEYFVYVLLVLLMFALLYNRGGLIMLGFIFLVIILSLCKRFRPWHIIVCALAGIAVLFLFGVFGNIRSGGDWNDTSYLIAVAEIDLSKVPSFLPKPFLWAYIYLVSPLGNLNNLVLNYQPTWQICGVLSAMIPDALGKRLFPEIGAVVLPRVLDNLTVSSGFAETYYFGGYPALVTQYAYMILLICFLMYASIAKKRYIYPMCALCCAITAFLFFDNYLNFIGVLFAFVYPIIEIAYDIYRRRFSKNKEKYRYFPPITPEIKFADSLKQECE